MTDRSMLRQRGVALREALFGSDTADAALANPLAGFGDLMAELVYGSLWSRPGLSLDDRMACTLAALVAVQNWAQLRDHVAAALRVGLAPLAIVEICIQDGIYRGFAASATALEVVQSVFAERGISLPAMQRADPLAVLTAQGQAMQARRCRPGDAGQAMQARLHAERKDAAHAAPGHPVAGTVYPLIVQYCYGEIWQRPGLDIRLRALCAVAAFAALDHDLLLRKFALSALNVGASREEVVEAVIQIGPYAGFAFTLKGLSAVSEAYAAG